MKYISGIHALNLPCSLDTTGDWHASSINWDNPVIRESSCSFFGRFGIEKAITEHYGVIFIANHIRAILDSMAEGNLVMPQGMKNGFICNDNYTGLIFQKVLEMRVLDHWEQIKQFMTREYRVQWVLFWRKLNDGQETRTNKTFPRFS